jgi:hypothetical protein
MLLPGEGETRTQVRVRRECDQCGEPATARLGFLLENYRRNPASKAFGRDDCSHITDAEAFICAREECEYHVLSEYQRKGYADSVSRWTLDLQRNAHLFLTWEVTRG